MTHWKNWKTLIFYSENSLIKSGINITTTIWFSFESVRGTTVGRHYERSWIRAISPLPYQRRKHFGFNYDFSPCVACRHSQWSDSVIMTLFLELQKWLSPPPIQKPRREVNRYQKGDYEFMRTETLKFAKGKSLMVTQILLRFKKNFNLITSFIQGSADKHTPSKTSRSVSSAPWITHEIRRKIHRKKCNSCKSKEDRLCKN